MNKQDIINLVRNDDWMMSVLKEAEKLGLPDWMIGAGFLRNKVWDYLHDIKRGVAKTSDIDLVYFDNQNINPEKDDELSNKMNRILGLEWEIKNQAYMHQKHDRTNPYKNSEQAIAEWVETATAVAVKLNNGEIEIIAPHGVDDLVNLIVRPTSISHKNLKYFNQRYKSKKWLETWPKLQVIVD